MLTGRPLEDNSLADLDDFFTQTPLTPRAISPTHTEFPQDESYAVQQEFVRELPIVTGPDKLNKTLGLFENSSNPLTVSTSIIPPGVEVKTIHHAVAEKGADSKEKGSSVAAIITRVADMEAGKKRETTTCRYSEGDAMVTMTLQFSPGGTPSLFKKDEPVSRFAQGLLFEDGAKKAGYVVSAVDTQDQSAGTRYTAFTK